MSKEITKSTIKASFKEFKESDSKFKNKSNKSLISEFEKYLKVEKKYNQKQIVNVCSKLDTILEHENRRINGEYYSNEQCVYVIHDFLREKLGPLLEQQNYWWDFCCGTCNLTKDLTFKNLFCSTLYNQDLVISRNNNPEAVKFPLNYIEHATLENGSLDLTDVKLPHELVRIHLKNENIIYFIAPPFSSSSSLMKVKKKGITKNKIKEMMLKEGFNRTSDELYCQFLYKIIKTKIHLELTNLTCVIVIPTSFLTLPSFKKFRELLFSNFIFTGGLVFKSNHYSQDLEKTWSICCMVLKVKPVSTVRDATIQDSFPVTLLIKKKNKFIFDSTKTIYNLDNSTGMLDWVKEPIRNLPKRDTIQLCNPLTTKHVIKNNKMTVQSMGWFQHSGSNAVAQNTHRTFILSSAYCYGAGVSITKYNFFNASCAYAAKRLLRGDWRNSFEQYLVPNIDHPDFYDFILNSLIIVLFDPTSQQSSLRNIIFQKTKKNIYNHLFWTPRSYMESLEARHDFKELKEDLNKYGSSNRYMAQVLSDANSELSSDAKDIYYLSINLVNKSFPARKELHKIHPEWHLNAWDAGWYQIKLILKERFPEDLKKFEEMYKKFKNKIKDDVYKLGFLK